jgi:hypothetical protein
MPGLERSAIDALQALGAARTPDAGGVERAWLQLQQRIVDGPPPIELDAPIAAGPRRYWIGLALAATAVPATIALVFASGSWVARNAEDPALHSAPYSSPPEQAPAIAPTRVDQAPVPATRDAAQAQDVVRDDAAPPAVAPTAAARPAAVRPRAAKPAPADDTDAPSTPPPAPKTTTLAAEMRLLAQANAAMRKGDASAALAKLDEHRRSFAQGQLAPERDVARAVALCELGKREAARAVVDAFRRDHASSPLLRKAEGVCRD